MKNETQNLKKRFTPTIKRDLCLFSGRFFVEMTVPFLISPFTKVKKLKIPYALKSKKAIPIKLSYNK